MIERPPEHVLDWLEETYDEEGQAIWLRNWHDADAQRRMHLLIIARSDGNG